MTTLNGTYQVLAADGSGNMVETGVNCLNSLSNYVYPVNCLMDQANGIDFGDLFIANMDNRLGNSGSFAGCQYIESGRAFYVGWRADNNYGAFSLSNDTLKWEKSTTTGWRVALCV